MKTRRWTPTLSALGPPQGGFYTATLSLIASFGAWIRSCFVPRYRSSGLDRSMAKQQLDLLQLPACRPAQLSAGPPQVVWCNAWNTGSLRVPLEHLPDDLLVQLGALNLILSVDRAEHLALNVRAATSDRRRPQPRSTARTIRSRWLPSERGQGRRAGRASSSVCKPVRGKM